jgi:uncharacterized membrane protein YfcA
MTLATLALLGGTIIVTSFISGTFGIAGGMILLGVLLVFFDVGTAMVLFSVVQLTSNTVRMTLWWNHIRWPILASYTIGAGLALGLLIAISYVPDKATVYLLLGLMPFAVEALPAAWRPNIERRGVPFFTGVATTLVQLLAGAGGPFLDIFFQKSSLDRKTTLATKSIAQSMGHVLRMAFFGLFAGAGDELALWSYGAAMAFAVGGTLLAPLVIERMSDHGFRQWTRWIILAIGAVYVVRAGWLFWQ